MGNSNPNPFFFVGSALGDATISLSFLEKDNVFLLSEVKM